MTEVLLSMRRPNQKLEELLRRDDSADHNESFVHQDVPYAQFKNSTINLCEEENPKDEAGKRRKKAHHQTEPPYSGQEEENREHIQPFDLRTRKSPLLLTPPSSTSCGEDAGSREALVERHDWCNESRDSDCFSCRMMENFDCLRRHHVLCDVVFQVQSQSFFAHKLVMASCSDVYKEVFQPKEGDKSLKEQEEVVTIEDISPAIFRLLLQFAYTGKTNLNQTNVVDLMEAAKAFKMAELEGKCRNFMRSSRSSRENSPTPDSHNGGLTKDLDGLDLTSSISKRRSPYYVKTNCEGRRPDSARRSEEQATNESLPKSPNDPASLSHAHLKKQEYIVLRNRTNSDPTKCDSKLYSNRESDRKDETPMLLFPNHAGDLNRTRSLSSEHCSGGYSPATIPNSTTTDLGTFPRGIGAYLPYPFPPFGAWVHPRNEKGLVSPLVSTSSIQRSPNHENILTSFLRSRMQTGNTEFPFLNDSSPFCPLPLSTGNMQKRAPEMPPAFPFSMSSLEAMKAQMFNEMASQASCRSHVPEEEDLKRKINSFEGNDKVPKLTYPYGSIGANSSLEDDSSRARAIMESSSLPSNPSKSDNNRRNKNKLRLNGGDVSKPYNCPLCDAHFNRPANLKTHMRIHSGEKPYKCETCGARFVQVAHLRAHVLIHTGEKPYPCAVCGTSFRHLQTLKSHLRIHTGEKPYSCEKCRVQFRHKSQLRLHLRTKHGVQTNTKKTYQQVPGLRSADISAHIKRAQEAARSNAANKVTSALMQRGCSEERDFPHDSHAPESEETEDALRAGASSNETSTSLASSALQGCQQSIFKLNIKAHIATLQPTNSTKSDGIDCNTCRPTNANST